jgi:predicted DNA-binding transcriptional regulator AlpA
MSDPLLNCSAIAELLSLSKRSVFRLEREGKMPRAIYLRNRAPRWRESQIREWIERGCPPAADEQPAAAVN